MEEHKPFTENWWWQKLLDHVYYCKWKYYDREEMKRDCEITDFIIRRIKIAQANNIVSQIHDKEQTPTIEGPDGQRYVNKEKVFSIIQQSVGNASIAGRDKCN